jgi:hypothetical protein
MKHAIILTGELRFDNENHFNEFIKFIDGLDVFISTYPKYEKLAKQITNNYMVSETSLPQGNMYQWYHLDMVIKQWKSILLSYEILIKLRTDLIFDKVDLKKLVANSNTIYPQTDQIFYADSKHFIHTFEDMFDNVISLYIKRSKDYYIPINYNNLINSNPNTNVKTAWLTLPKQIYSNNFLKLQNNIKENKNIFLIDNSHISEMEMEFGMKTGYSFTSERCFLIQSINKGIVDESIINGILMNNRKEQNWGILN